jgi:succinyl-CoA synthetase alpha subunit
VSAAAAPDAAFRPVDAIFRARSIALVGASESGWTATIVRNLRARGASAALYPINPKRETVWGERCYPSFAALPAAVDLALTIVPAPAVAPALREGLEHGLRAAIVYAAGFGEGGDRAGDARAADLRALASAGLRICGPNCMGTLSPREGLMLYPSTRVRDVPAGDVGLAMQSGGLFQYWLQYAVSRGLGVSYAASVGNELDLDVADYINFFVGDEHTRVICCFIEGVRRPAAFTAAAAAALAAHKPIVLVKSGRSERARSAVQSHTGSLAGDDRVFDAVCERYGIVRAATLDEMVEHALVLRTGRIPAGAGGVMAIGYSSSTRRPRRASRSPNSRPRRAPRSRRSSIPRPNSPCRSISAPASPSSTRSSPRSAAWSRTIPTARCSRCRRSSRWRASSSIRSGSPLWPRRPRSRSSPTRASRRASTRRAATSNMRAALRSCRACPRRCTSRAN